MHALASARKMHEMYRPKSCYTPLTADILYNQGVELTGMSPLQGLSMALDHDGLAWLTADVESVKKKQGTKKSIHLVSVIFVIYFRCR